MPKVSVLLPVYNAEAFLALALASLLQQTQGDMAIIAIDDGSTDLSGAILDAAAEEDRRIRVIRRENRGLVATLNEALDLADSDDLARMDADDLAYPLRIEMQQRILDANAGLGLLGCNFDTILRPGLVLPAPPPILTRPGARAILGRFCTPLRHPTVMMRRSRIPEGMLRYDPAYPCAEDFDLFRRLGAVTGIAQTAAPHLAYRLHPGSVSVRQIGVQTQSHLRILEENLARHYPAAAGTGFVGLGDAVTAARVAAAAEMIRRLDAMTAAQPEAERAAFATGVTNSFYFLFALLRRSADHGLARDFVAAAGRWPSIRRRERLLLQADPVVPGLAGLGFPLSDWSAGLRHRLAAQPAGLRVPHHDQLLRRARRFEAAARGGHGAVDHAA